MRHALISVSLVLLTSAVLPVHAADNDSGGGKKASSTALDAKNNPMKKCTQEARKKKLRGEERRDYMNSCLDRTKNATTDGKSRADQPAMETPKP